MLGNKAKRNRVSNFVKFCIKKMFKNQNQKESFKIRAVSLIFHEYSMNISEDFLKLV